jgi:NAD(P)-dependent dehydrogenase (short-subunit alcohol dehydrogenase family)
MTQAIDMSGKVVIVTGGSRGVGRGITEKFLEAGAVVAICGRNAPETLPTASGNTAEFYTVDVRDADQANAMVDAVYAKYGRLDVLINNAGGAPFADAATASPRFSESIIRLNLLAPLNFAQAANRIMQQQESGGAIINIASVSAVPQRGRPHTAPPRPG